MVSSSSGTTPSVPEPLRLLLVGANHRTCPIDVRESLVQRVTYRRFGAAQRANRPFEDLVLLSTCNRVEAYVATSSLDSAKSTLYRGFGVPLGSQFLYELEGAEAAVHLFRVAAGLDSVALGESQIADQVRRASGQRPKSWRTGSLADLFARAARIAARLRRVAGMDGRAASASDAAVRYVREVIRPHGRVTLLGSGKMARLAAEALPGDIRITVVNRDYRKAVMIAERLGGHAARESELYKVLRETDALVAATSSKRRIIEAPDLAKICAVRSRPLWIIDLGMPRNVDPSAAGVKGLRIVTLDDLAPWAGLPPDPAARARTESIIRAEAEAFLESLRPRDTDRVAALRIAAEHVRQSEVRLALARIPRVTEDEREILEKMSSRLVNRLLHGPTELVRRLQAEGRDGLIENLFDSTSPAGGRK